MASYDLDIQSYRASHTALWIALTKVSAAGYRYCDRDSAAEHTVTVRDGAGGVALTLRLRHNDLYIIGFEGRGGRVFAFADQAPGAFDQRLNMSVNYAHVSKDAKNAIIDRDAVVEAITALSDHAGDGWNALSSPFLIMALLVSEAMRFTPIFEKMCQVVARGGTANTKFSTWQAMVTSWSSQTTVLHGHAKLMKRPSQYDVRTWHRFER